MNKQEREAVDAVLEAWARWAKSALSGIGWPPESLIYKIIKYGARGAAQQSGIRMVETDRLCEVVDAAITKLPSEERQVLIRHYMDPAPDCVSARIMWISPSWFSEQLTRAKGKIKRYMDSEDLVHDPS